jgi:hypothetical protein
MPKRKKAKELTDSEALKRLFPKPVREGLKKVAHERDDQEPPKGPQTKGK